MTSLYSFIFCILLAGGVYCDTSDNTLITGAKVLYRAIRDCEDGYVYTCLKVRALKSINKLLNKNEVTLFDGVSFNKISKAEGARDFDESVNEIDVDSFPKDPTEREETVDSLLQDRLTRFFTSHVLKIGLPNIPQTFEEGRGSGGILGGGGGGGGNKGDNGPMLAAAMMGMSVKALFIKGLALVAAKALLVAKIALVLVTILGLHKLFHQDQHGHHGHHEHYHHKYHGKKVHEHHIPLHHGGEFHEGHFGGGGMGGSGIGGGHFEFEDAGHFAGNSLGGAGLSGGFGGGHFAGLSAASLGHGSGSSDLGGIFAHGGGGGGAGGSHDRTVRFRRDIPDFRSHLLAYRRQIV